MEIWAIGTTRNEVDLVELNLRHHAREGIDRFLIYDDNSSDGTAEALERLRKRYPLDWRSTSGPFRQHELLTVLAHEAFARGATWVIPIDADEFWHSPGRRLRQVLCQSKAGALQVEVVNFIQRREQAQTTVDCVRFMTRRCPQPVGPLEDIEANVEAKRCAFVEIRYPPKWITRASADVRLGWGNHYVERASGNLDKTDGIVCLHAPLRSKEVLLKKADLQRPPAEVEEYLSKAWHLRRWRRIAGDGLLESEWRANSYEADALDLNGTVRPVVEDMRLRNLVVSSTESCCSLAGTSPDGRLIAAVKTEVWTHARQCDGWFEESEAYCLMDMVAKRASTADGLLRIVEVGSFCGRSTTILAHCVRALGVSGVVHSIDPHEGTVGAVDGAPGVTQTRSTYDTFVANLAWAIESGLVEPNCRRSTEVEWRNAIDVLLLDGLHDYQSVRNDLGHFSRHVAIGGFVAFHDRSVDFPAVGIWVDCMLASGTYTLWAESGSLVVLQKCSDTLDHTLLEPVSPVDQLADRARQIQVLDRSLDLLRSRVDNVERHNRSLSAELATRQSRIDDLLRSRSWRLTAPLRALWRWLGLS